VANTLAYYDTATITAVKSFIVQAPVFDYFFAFNLIIGALSFRRCDISPTDIKDTQPNLTFTLNVDMFN
jgi:hypothetical protein